MIYDIGRVATLVAAGLFAGLLIDRPTAGVAFALVVYALLQVWELGRLYGWLQSRREDNAPVLHGMLSEVIHEVQYLRRHHSKRKQMLTRFLDRFQEAAMALPDAIVILDPDNRIEWANTRAEKYLGIGWPQDAGQRLANLIRRPGLQDFLVRSEKEQHSENLTLPSPEESGLMLELRVMPYGDRLRLLIARDVTQIQRVNQMRRDFIANASHELRTPLTVIAGYLEAMEGDERLEAAGLEGQIRQMRNQAARMQSLIEDLLMLSSLESEAEQHKEDVVLVPDILSNICNEARAVSGDRGHVFTLELQTGLCIRGNPNEIYSAFSNLVMNAVHYTPAGGDIAIRWHADEAGAYMEVADTGEGIAPEHISRLTERFYRVDRARSRESGGTGLGLAIVKHVLTRHQARLHIQSEPGKGSLFRCDFKPDRIVMRQTGEMANTAQSST